MRYLYGDSVPFPPQHDFLAALDACLEHAVSAASLEIEALGAVRRVEENASHRVALLADLDAVHTAFVGAARHALGTVATKDPSSPVQRYATRIIGEAERLHAEVRHGEQAQLDRDRAEAAALAAQRRGQSRAALEAMLIATRLPVVESRVSMVLEDGACAMTTWITHPEQLALGFALGTDRAPEWQKPRKVSDFADGVTMPVGVKRSIFKRTVQHEPMTLDDLTIGGFDLSDDGCHLRLRRRPDQPDILELVLQRSDNGAFAEVHHLEPNTEGLPNELDATDAMQLERFWTLLRSASGPLHGHRTRLLGATVAGKDVFEHHMTLEVVKMVIRMVAPIAEEVARRSPNPNELSLKLEHDGGRREEIYLKKSVLGQRLANVASEAKHAFEPLVFLQG